jgi:adenine-specific DNA methylase
LVIGNPPYGNFTGKYSVEERKLTKATQYEDYFILRGLDLCVTGGLVVFVVPSRFLDSGEIVVKNSIAEKGELLDAYRLPKGVFDQTEVQTDIVVLKRI